MSGLQWAPCSGDHGGGRPWGWAPVGAVCGRPWGWAPVCTLCGRLWGWAPVGALNRGCLVPCRGQQLSRGEGSQDQFCSPRWLGQVTWSLRSLCGCVNPRIALELSEAMVASTRGCLLLTDGSYCISPCVSAEWVSAGFEEGWVLEASVSQSLDKPPCLVGSQRCGGGQDF